MRRDFRRCVVYDHRPRQALADISIVIPGLDLEGVGTIRYHAACVRAPVPANLLRHGDSGLRVGQTGKYVFKGDILRSLIFVDDLPYPAALTVENQEPIALDKTLIGDAQAFEQFILGSVEIRRDVLLVGVEADLRSLAVDQTHRKIDAGTGSPYIVLQGRGGGGDLQLALILLHRSAELKRSTERNGDPHLAGGELAHRETTAKQQKNSVGDGQFGPQIKGQILKAR
ncbi:hypothetical protein ES708_32601 [subsurface metagenome]